MVDLQSHTKLHWIQAGGCLSICLNRTGEHQMKNRVQQLWSEEKGQDIAEYAVMLAVILVIVVGTVKLIGSNANSIFSSIASSLQ